MMWKDRWSAIVKKIEVIDTAGGESALLARLTPATVPRVLAFVNAHAMNSCATDLAFFEALASADILLRDGSGMAILFRHTQRDPGLNMNGTDLIPKILATFRGRSVALWGTRDPFLEQAVLRSEREFAVRVTSCADGFCDVNHYLRLARETLPDLIVLGMGMPKQEQLAKALRTQAAGPALIVCGGAILDFLGGKVVRAPKFMRRIGLEWLYRFALEPRRLFRRYVMGNPAFLLKLAAWKRDGAP